MGKEMMTDLRKSNTGNTDNAEITISKVNELISTLIHQVEYSRLTKSTHTCTRKELFESLNEKLLILDK
jgi:hypothetical protein